MVIPEAMMRDGLHGHTSEALDSSDAGKLDTARHGEVR